MAKAVEAAIEEKRHLIVEAGTGTGKTMAYLVPALRSGKRVIISTGTKNLQEQLFYKDVPFLKQHFGEMKVCYMKGRSNYLCRKKLYEFADQPILSGLEEIDQFRAIVDWDKTTETGDRAELAVLPESSEVWHKLDARADTCLGQKCREFERCFITEMRRKALESDIIIVNHHLFFADLAIKMAADEAPDVGVLPEAAAVIFDEAHELEEVASSYFGVGVSTARIEELARDVENAAVKAKAMSASMMQGLKSLRERSQFFFSLLPEQDNRFAFDGRQEFLETHGDEYLGLMNVLGRVATDVDAAKPSPEEAPALIRRINEVRTQLAFIMETEDRNTVFWIERRGGGRNSGASLRRPGFHPSEPKKGSPGAPGLEARSHKSNAGSQSSALGRNHVFLQATPIDVSGILRNVLFERLDTTVLTSATLAVGGGYEYVRRRLGMENARELIVASHFDYESQALLYIPPDLPEPNSPQFTAKASDRIRRLLEISQGRAFVLFTSYAQMRDVHDRLLGELEHPMLLQGTAPKTALLEEFRTTPNAVLFATSSFWQGVDVQGEQLSCVIIDRLPFAVPSDPVVKARVEAINNDGGNAFYDYQVPAAVITLKQGFGRLIRSLNDRGVLALLDNRILKKPYGRMFLSSLPPYKRTTTLSDVEAFFS
jgi:ATP-dependent DNA helicase DinG